MIQTRKIRINILVCLIVLAGFLSVGTISYITYSHIIRDDIKNISKLTATNIYSDINSQLTKPIFVALTMANDSFVKDWLAGEQDNISDPEYQMKMTNYLNGLKEKYNYNSVFLVSDYSKNYYHFKGINKVISEKNQHDIWYYDYLKSNLIYELDVDTDEANKNSLSVFINCKIEDDLNNILGVTGVGLELNKVQDLLNKYKKDFHLDAMLFDQNGVVQIHSDSSLIEKVNVFQYNAMEENRETILNDKDSVAVYQYSDEDSEGYMIVKYIEDLDWYLLVKKDTSILEKSFQASLIPSAIVFLIAVALIIIIIGKLVRNNDKELLMIAKTDALSGLTNRRGFDEALQKIIHSPEYKDRCAVFVFDIDNFKKVNDIHGHLLGDDLLCHIAKIVSNILKENGKVFRWGGDEFAGFIFGDQKTIDHLTKSIFTMIRNSAELEKYHATISMGITSLQEADTIDTLLKRADTALYAAKENGKNRYVVM
jgi:diguanylate cyclase (GGDEF)-like protein